MRRIAAMAILLVSCAPKSGRSSSAIALVHATIIDVSARASVRDGVIVIDRGHIAAVAPVGGATIPKDARVIDATGKYVVPGLWDMHTHLFRNGVLPGTDRSFAFPLYVANGVTGVRDMWTDPDDIVVARRWNAERTRGTLLAPRIEWSSQILDGDPPSFKQSTAVATTEQARHQVDELKARGAKFIKVYWNLPRDVFLAVADEARKSGIPFGGHVPGAVSAFEASDAGMKSIEHLTGVLETCSSRSEELQKITTPDWGPKANEMMWNTFDEKRCAELIARFAKNRTWQVPTLIQTQSRMLAEEGGLVSNPALAYVPASEKDGWNTEAAERPRRPSMPVEVRRARFARYLRIVGQMDQAGVGILAGSDFGNNLIVPGFSLHDELALMVEAGLSPLAALQTATRNVGIYFGRDDIGTIASGSLADLVILDADPTIDIRNTRRIAGVVLDGRYLSRGELDALLQPLHRGPK
jgi:imidazolonepropionase-like amidohydrolase